MNIRTHGQTQTSNMIPNYFLTIRKLIETANKFSIGFHLNESCSSICSEKKNRMVMMVMLNRHEYEFERGQEHDMYKFNLIPL